LPRYAEFAAKPRTSRKYVCPAVKDADTKNCESPA